MISPRLWAALFASLFSVFLSIASPAAQAACAPGACITVGPRVATVDTAQSALLNGLLTGLTGSAGSAVNLTALDWRQMAGLTVNLGQVANALQVATNVSTPEQAAVASVSLSQLISAVATASATQTGGAPVAASLNTLATQLAGTSGNLTLGSLVQSTNGLGSTNLNVLELVTGAVQLYNTQNVATTTKPVTLDISALGISGIASGITLYAQVIEAPVFACGGVGTTAHGSSIRVRLDLALLNLSLAPGLASVNVGNLSLYVEVAHADAIITAINAIGNAITVNATPGIASLYIGTISDSVFTNRSRTINYATDVTPGSIGTIRLAGITVALLARAYANGSNGSTALTFTGATAGAQQSQMATAGAPAIGTLLTTLIGNLELTAPGLGLDAVINPVLALLKPLLVVTLNTVLSPILTAVVDPLLRNLGVSVGQAVVNTGGVTQVCTAAGFVYNDANHNTARDTGETGTGLTLYAKLVPVSGTNTSPGAVVPVNASTGAFSFAGLAPGVYSVVINADTTVAGITPAVPTGWIGTQNPTLAVTVTVLATTLDTGTQWFGLYHGSRVSGLVWKDNGVGSTAGVLADNGLKDGTEPGLGSFAVKLTDASGTVTSDSTVTAADGTYALYLPYTASGAVKVTQTNTAEWFAVTGAVGTSAGVYTRASAASASIALTSLTGGSATGVNFGNVPANRFEPDGAQTLAPATAGFYSHRFTAGSTGTLTVTSSAPAAATAAGWSTLLFADANCNGQVDAGELPLAATSVVADQVVCVVVRVFAPAGAAINAQYPVTLTAHLAYALTALAADHLRNDLTTVGTPTDSALGLVKTVDKTLASSGETVSYTITFINRSTAALAVKNVYDETPVYTVFTAATCGAMPTPGPACTVASQPTAGTAGKLTWTFTGALPSGGSGAVTFTVTVQ
ncbi:MAG: hypothetical protein JWQ11_409 [Rhizobacter sp.]|nr:hypothetical protein [Rhizobacter sp.]